jgi:hypothetical protein
LKQENGPWVMPSALREPPVLNQLAKIRSGTDHRLRVKDFPKTCISERFKKYCGRSEPGIF